MTYHKYISADLKSNVSDTHTISVIQYKDCGHLFYHFISA